LSRIFKLQTSFTPHQKATGARLPDGQVSPWCGVYLIPKNLLPSRIKVFLLILTLAFSSPALAPQLHPGPFRDIIRALKLLGF
jgi:hypothetical protein